jgi:hypothetical protein
VADLTNAGQAALVLEIIDDLFRRMPRGWRMWKISMVSVSRLPSVPQTSA